MTKPWFERDVALFPPLDDLTRDMINELLDAYKKQLWIRDKIIDLVTDMTFDEWYDDVGYPGGHLKPEREHKKELRKVWNAALREAISVLDTLSSNRELTALDVWKRGRLMMSKRLGKAQTGSGDE